MSTRNSLLLTFALAAMPLASGACGDHRNEDFCATRCECQGGNQLEVQSCTANCTDAINSAEDSASATLISDECFSCVTNSSCQRVEVECASACESLVDDVNPPQPTPETDPRPGDQ